MKKQECSNIVEVLRSKIKSYTDKINRNKDMIKLLSSKSKVNKNAISKLQRINLNYRAIILNIFQRNAHLITELHQDYIKFYKMDK